MTVTLVYITECVKLVCFKENDFKWKLIVSMYICVYTYEICMRGCTYTHIRYYINRHLHTPLYTHKYIYTYAHPQPYLYVHIQKYRHR